MYAEAMAGAEAEAGGNGNSEAWRLVTESRNTAPARGFV